MRKAQVASASLALCALVVAGTVPIDGQTSPRPGSSGAPAPNASFTPVPLSNAPISGVTSPSPAPTLPPANATSRLSFPVYGTPVPGVNRGTAIAGIPVLLTLDQAISIAVASSPVLAAARADVGLAQAAVLLQKTQRNPLLDGTATVNREFLQAGAGGVSSALNNTGSTGTGTGTTTGIGGGTGATPIPVPSTSGGGGTGAGGGAGGGTATPQPVGAATPPTTTAASSGVRPSLESTRSALSSAPNAAALIASGADPTIQSNAFAVSFRQLIYDGGRVRAEIEAATYSETSSANSYKRQLQTVAYNVAVAYYNALAAARTTEVDLETVRLDQVNENLVNAQYRAGTAARTDVATAALPVAQARLAVIRAQGQELSSLATFANVLGLEADTLVSPVDDTPNFQSALKEQVAVPTYQTAITRAYLLRPDLVSQQNLYDSARASLRAAKLGLFPTLDGDGSYNLASTDTAGGTFRNSSEVGVSLTIPILDQGVTHAETLQAQANVALAAANFQNQRQTVQLNVKQALVNLVAARSALDEAQAEYLEASEVLRATQAQYRAGVTTLPLLLNAQVGVTQALTDQVTAVYTLRQTQQALYYALGSNI